MNNLDKKSSWGGCRQGAGRPPHSKSISNELREAFREHTQTALDAIVSIANDANHPQHFKALELILNRGYGSPVAFSEAESIITDYLAGTITAEYAGLLLESHGLTVGRELRSKINDEQCAKLGII